PRGAERADDRDGRLTIITHREHTSMAGIFAFAEARDGDLRKVAQEVVTAARKLGDGLGEQVHAVILGGPGVREHAPELARFGADRIYVGESESLAKYSPEGFTTLVANFIKEHGCKAALFPASAMGKDLAPRVAARLGVGYANECTAIEAEGDQVVAVRPRYAGKVFARETFAGSPAVLSLRGNVFTPVENPGAGEVETLDVSLDTADFGAIVREIRAGAGEKLDVSEAPVIVAGGRGLRDPESFRLR